MYCVKCGVRLQDGVKTCPLCNTPVWNPDGDAAPAARTYPDTLPRRYRESALPGVVALSVFCAVAIAVVVIVCLRLYGSLEWGGYAVGGVLLGYILAVLPKWFRKPLWAALIPVDHAAAALYTLYICLHTGGRWFMSFAFPVIGMSCALSTALYCLLRYVRGGRLFIFGGFMILLGGFTVLVEFFEHISFRTPMFLWSLYALAGFGTAGLLLLMAGIIPPLREALERRFFF